MAAAVAVRVRRSKPLTADPQTRLVAVADAFPDRMISSLSALSSKDDISKQVTVDADHQFVGFDGYRHVIESDVDVVLLATPPHFRPIHLRAAVEAGKHVFVENRSQSTDPEYDR
ncbi:MAG: Gfo/Idh/MocA family oxidoreductase [Pirellulaceae bacterium]